MLGLGWLLSGSLTLVLAAGSAGAQKGRQEVSLDGSWKFALAQVAGDTAPGFDESKMESVVVPHSWPAEGQSLPGGGFRARATYRTMFASSPAWRGKRVLLRFDAVSLTAEVTLNGKLMGTHKGGFARFGFDVTDALRWDAPNVLAVHVSNEADPDLSPLAGDFTVYGGIYRPVSLVVLEPVHVNVQDMGSAGVFLQQKVGLDGGGEVRVRTEISNDGKESAAVVVKTVVRDAAGNKVASSTASETVRAGVVVEDRGAMRVERAHLWNGVDDPYLYTVVVEVLRAGHLLDRVVQPLGFRTESFDAGKGFVLNGHAMQMRGVCLHQEGATAGWAVSAADEAGDMTLIRAMGANAIRLAHYQHSQSFLDLADRTGMLIWAELAQVDRVSGTAAYRTNVRQQLQELIRQNYNHPSIFVWSLYNELNSPTKDLAIPLVHELNDLAHAEDPTRPTSGAASADTIEHLHAMVAGVDLISLNTYPGWYFGEPGDMGSSIEKWNTAYGGRGIGITEYGAGASVKQHNPQATKADVQTKGHIHPEEWQANVHEGNYAAIVERPYVWGSFIWNMFDFSSAGRHEGDADGVNDKGLVTRDRAIRKDAYFFYQANWTQKPMAHLVGCSKELRGSGVVMVKAYSNQSTLTLLVNGTNAGAKGGSSIHVFAWNDVHLPEGATELTLLATGKELDRCVVP